MTLSYRKLAYAVVLALGVGMTAIACTQTASEGKEPVVTVYATPT
jgi:hypothetical protein